jgi:two-component system, OmpR family, response regulator CpxR
MSGHFRERPTLLCVDDEAEILTLRKIMLESSGYTVLTAGSGVEALKIATENRGIALVLLDYLMPQMRGDDLAARLKEEQPNLPILIVSAVHNLPESFLGMAAGYVQKGEDPTILLSKVAEIVQERGERT